MRWREAGLIAVAIGLGAWMATAQAPQWTLVGPLTLQQQAGQTNIPVGGPLEALAIPPQAQANLLLAGGVGGVWQFSGGSWQALSQGEAVSALAVAADGTVYAGTGEQTGASPSRTGDGLLVLHAGSAAWMPSGASYFTGLVINTLVVDAGNNNHLLATAVAADDSPAGAKPGLYASGDGGQTWTLVLAAAAHAVMQGGSVLAAGADGVQISTAGGAADSFVPLTGLPPGWSAAAVSAAAGGGFLLLLSTPGGGGSLWTISATGVAAQLCVLPAGFTSTGTLSVAASGNMIWAGGTGLWESGDGGQNWTQAAMMGTQQHALLADSAGSVWAANNQGLWQVAPAAGAQSLNAGLVNAAPLAISVGAGGFSAALAGGGGASADAGAADWLVNASSPAHNAGLAGSAWWAGATAVAVGPQGLWTGDGSGELLGPQGLTHSFPSSIGGIAIANGSIWVASGAEVYRSQDGGLGLDAGGLRPCRH